MEPMNEWHRIDGPTRSDGDWAGDDFRGEYSWTSLYGCGRARAEVIHYLGSLDMMSEWEGENEVVVVEATHLYVIDSDGEIDDTSHEEYQYEAPGLYAYAASTDEAARAYRALDSMADADMSWAFCGPNEKAPEVYDRKPSLREWDAAMVAA